MGSVCLCIISIYLFTHVSRDARIQDYLGSNQDHQSVSKHNIFVPEFFKKCLYCLFRRVLCLKWSFVGVSECKLAVQLQLDQHFENLFLNNCKKISCSVSPRDPRVLLRAFCSSFLLQSRLHSITFYKIGSKTSLNTCRRFSFAPAPWLCRLPWLSSFCLAKFRSPDLRWITIVEAACSVLLSDSTAWAQRELVSPGPADQQWEKRAAWLIETKTQTRSSAKEEFLETKVGRGCILLEHHEFVR